MASGWAPDGAVQDQIDDTVMDGVLRARASIPAGDGDLMCVECGEDIPEARRRVLPGVRTCIACSRRGIVTRRTSGSTAGAAKIASSSSASALPG